MAIRGFSHFRFRFLSAAIAAAGALSGPPAALAQGQPAASGSASAPAAVPLRVCADPDNLPFSAEAGAERGLYIELAERVGRELGMPVEYVWYYTHMQRRALRNTIQAKACDATFALPANADYRARGVRKSRPFLDVGYALVAAPGVRAASLEALKPQRIGVQFSTTPHIVLSQFEGYRSTTYRNPDEVFAALARGEVDVALMWGPIAGYENQRKHQGRWQITPVSGHDFAGSVVVGVLAERDDLRARIDEALARLQPEIKSLAQKYGFPVQAPVNLEAKPGSALPGGLPRMAANPAVAIPAAAWVPVNDPPKPAAAKASAPPPRRPAQAPAPAKPAATKPAAAAPATAAAATAAPVLSAQAQAGRVRFNDQCSHCHGTDGASPIRERDVRRLSMRYDADKWKAVADKTIRNGRSDLGMPAWKDTIGDQQIGELMAFLETIQK